MKKSFNKKIIENIQEKNLVPKPKNYFLAKEILLWIGTSLAVLLGAISAGSFIFQIYNQMLLPPQYIIGFGLLRIAIVSISISLALYQILHTQKGYKRKKTTYLIVGLFVVMLLGSLMFFTNISGSFENSVGRAGIISQSTKYWSQPETGLLAGELKEVTSNGYLLVNGLEGRLHIVDTQNISETQQDIFIDFLRVKMVGYQQDEIFYPCVVSPWKLRGAAIEKRPDYTNIKNGNIQFSKGKRDQENFNNFFERKNDIVRSNSC